MDKIVWLIEYATGVGGWEVLKAYSGSSASHLEFPTKESAEDTARAISGHSELEHVYRVRQAGEQFRQDDPLFFDGMRHEVHKL